ncbi:hypothetical protein BN2476_350062 [Paraburkholderia piptadeniae]|uniref:Uncharacterized protein n=1 Tax=Paraburkholderia piptadeniae TaxID=1701573 RepID=A0A1N7S7Q1_9BURK|nr:hypothetical protein BN2476_350062 [Paraburkholderia piptadeniae]
MVRGRGLEPLHPCGRQDLNLVRLPISPSSQPGVAANLQRPIFRRRPDAAFFHCNVIRAEDSERVVKDPLEPRTSALKSASESVSARF